MKKEAPQKRKGLTQKTSDEKRCISKIQRGSCKRPPMKKEAPKNVNGLMQKTSDEKRGTLKP
jgi:hypothetical protein